MEQPDRMTFGDLTNAVDVIVAPENNVLQVTEMTKNVVKFCNSRNFQEFLFWQNLVKF